MASREDWTGVVEAAYRLDFSDAEWVQHIVDVIASWRNAGFGVLGYIFDVSGERLDVQSYAVSGMPDEIAPKLLGALQSIPPESFLPLLLHPRPYGTISDTPGLEGVMDFIESNRDATGVHDSFGLVARVHWRGGLVVGVNLPERQGVSAHEIRRLASASAHLEAGLRLRQALGGEASLETPDVEAVLEPDGRVVHADGAAAGRSARDRLREAAQRIDRARGRLRHKDPDGSLALWQGMVEGRWSLVDHFDNDGRRFVVARRNSVRFRDPRALTEREAQVAHQVSLGKTNAEAAYALGLTESTVRNHLTSAMGKLGIGRRVDLVRMASAPVREAMLDTDAGELIVRSAGVELDDLLEGATEVERETLRLIAGGLTNREISVRRGVSEHTVANQVAGLLRKFEVGTREELVSRVMSGP